MNHDGQDTLRALLRELNQRSRWYVAQLWQVSLAFTAATALPLVQLIRHDVDGLQLALGFLGAALIGVFVFLHLLGVLNDGWRAVKDLRIVEGKLPLPENVSKSQWTRDDYLPLVSLVIILSTGYLLAGLWILCPLIPREIMNQNCLLEPRWFIVWGLVLDIIGAVLIVIPVITAAREARKHPGLDTMKEWAQKLVASFYARLGLTAIILGFILQIWGAWPR